VKTLILGIGNLLRSDDGVGLHVIEALRKEETGDNIDLIEALSGLDILDAIKGYDRIILVDAIKTGGEPGTIYELSLKDIQAKHTNHSFSTHLNMDLQTMLELGDRLFPGKIPKDIRVIAVEAEDVTTISDRCTPEVERAISKTVDMIKGLI